MLCSDEDARQKPAQIYGLLTNKSICRLIPVAVANTLAAHAWRSIAADIPMRGAFADMHPCNIALHGKSAILLSTQALLACCC